MGMQPNLFTWESHESDFKDPYNAQKHNLYTKN